MFKEAILYQQNKCQQGSEETKKIACGWIIQFATILHKYGNLLID